MTLLHRGLADLKLFCLAPDFACCPRCGEASARNEVRRLRRRCANVQAATYEEVDVGCYLCPNCPAGERWFRLQPPGFEGDGRYTTSTRRAVVSLVTAHKMSFDGAAALARALLHLEGLAGTTVMRWFREDGKAVDTRQHLAMCAESFSGQLALDEVYDGGFFVIKATDPVNNVELDSWLGEGSPSKQDVRELLEHLRDKGIVPELIVTDGSPLYPAVVAEVFPNAGHQRCVFHFIKRALELLRPAFFAAVRSLPQPKKRPRGRPKKRGRPRKDKQKRANIKKVRACRYLVFKRGGLDDRGRPRIGEHEQAQLDEAYRQCPDLRDLRDFVEALYDLFSPSTDSHDMAEARRAAILAREDWRSRGGIGKVMAQLADDDLFKRLTRHLDFDNARKTSNHVERENREFRKRQRSHYRLRTVLSMCAFLDLMKIRKAAPDKPVFLVRRRRPDKDANAEVTHTA